MLKFFLIFIVFLLFNNINATEKLKYTKIRCDKNKICYKKGKLVSKKKMANSNITTQKIYDLEPNNMKGITEAHNIIRKQLGIAPLVWSNEIADYAKIWANYLKRYNHCNMKHRPSYGKYKRIYGENLSWFSPIVWSDGKKELQKVNTQKAIQGWIDERAFYSYKRNKCQSGKVCGHYTQLIWAKSKRLGCAMAICNDKSQIWVCNYDPPGNYVGQKPY